MSKNGMSFNLSSTEGGTLLSVFLIYVYTSMINNHG